MSLSVAEFSIKASQSKEEETFQKKRVKEEQISPVTVLLKVSSCTGF